ncbi:MAG: cupin domain-containing protein [Aridibacter sp.]
MTNEIKSSISEHIESAEIVLPCKDLNETVDFFTERLGFRLKMIFPADSPNIAVVSGYGITMRFETKLEVVKTPFVLRLLCDVSSLNDETQNEIFSPDGMRLELVDAKKQFDLPTGTQEFVLSRMSDEDVWETGRAEMQYRDLIPSRLGGRFIASHIRIPGGGEVPDYVHFHKIRFQMIYCKAGWAKLVYEDQGEPFLFKEGDCVLQPPEMRHRVLETSEAFEVIEIGCPAVHETFADHELELPTKEILPEKIFGGQHFVRHIAAEAVWTKSPTQGLEIRNTGIGKATNGLAEVRVVKSINAANLSAKHSGEFLFFFVLKGELELNIGESENHQLKSGDSCVIPAETAYNLHFIKGVEMLEVFLAN